MVEIRNEGGSGEGRGNVSRRRRLFPTDTSGEPVRPVRERTSTRVWRRPEAGAAPTRPVADLLEFSSVDSANQGPSDNEEMDQAWLDARSRAFRQLDEWLTWDSVVDDESVFAPEGFRPRNARFEFVLKEVIADPVDVLHYSLRPFSVFL
jgi:hypothetical protein